MLFRSASAHFKKGSHVVSMGRSAPKEHGDPADRYFIGAPRGKTLVLEDVTTTGRSLFSAIDRLRNSGIDVVGALTLTDRCEEPVEEEMKRLFGANLRFLKMSSAPELLPNVK